MKYDSERLIILMEEAGEVIQAASKILRFGPSDENLSDLVKESADLSAMIDLLEIPEDSLQEHKASKLHKLRTYSNIFDRNEVWSN